MTTLEHQFVAALENLTHNTQYALDKAIELNSDNFSEDLSISGPFKDVYQYVDDLITLSESFQGLSTGGKIAEKKDQDVVFSSFKTFSTNQKKLFSTFADKAGQTGGKGKVSGIVNKLQEYKSVFDKFIDQLAQQCPDDADAINSEHKAVDEALSNTIQAWS